LPEGGSAGSFRFKGDSWIMQMNATQQNLLIT
jgi:hypothetical protein